MMLFVNPKLNIKKVEDEYFKAAPVEITRKKTHIKIEKKLLVLVIILVLLSIVSFVMVLV